MYYNDRKGPSGTDRFKPRSNDNRDNSSRGGGRDHSSDSDQGVPNPYESYSCKGNLGLLYTRRYYNEIDENVLDGRKITINSPNGGKPIKTDYQTLYYNSRNSNIIRQARRAPLSSSALISGATPLPLETTYPGLLTGVGIPHGTGHNGEAKLGLVFDHTTGLPYIPGSSVKGLLRSVFPLQDEELAEKYDRNAKDYEKKNKQDKANECKAKAKALRLQAGEKRNWIVKLLDNKISTDQVDDLERSIFVGEEIDKKTGELCFVSQRDIFFDALPTAMSRNGLLGLDFITPHKNNEFKDPTPIQFMRIEPGVTFRFEFSLRDSQCRGEILCDKETKRDLFEKILTTVGIGAKTNVGYGQLKSE